MSDANERTANALEWIVENEKAKNKRADEILAKMMPVFERLVKAYGVECESCGIEPKVGGFRVCESCLAYGHSPRSH